MITVHCSHHTPPQIAISLSCTSHPRPSGLPFTSLTSWISEIKKQDEQQQLGTLIDYLSWVWNPSSLKCAFCYCQTLSHPHLLCCGNTYSHIHNLTPDPASHLSHPPPHTWHLHGYQTKIRLLQNCIHLTISHCPPYIYIISYCLPK